MSCVAKRIKDTEYVFGYAPAAPDIASGNREVFCKSSGAVNAYTKSFFSQVGPAGAHITATAGNDVTLTGNDLTRNLNRALMLAF